MTTIKTIATTKYEITMFETRRGYVVKYKVLDKTVKTKPIQDFNQASYVFAARLQELQGQ